jgi:hypothetical protein
MKLKVVFASAAVLAIAAVVFAFAKPTTTVTFYYDNSVGLTRGPLNGTSQLIQSEVKTAADWITTAQLGGSGSYLNSIQFDQEAGDVSNGIADGHYSKQEAINAVWDEYVRNSQFTLPTDGNSFTPAVSGASPITIGRASSN